jgi:hypothetical protein
MTEQPSRPAAWSKADERHVIMTNGVVHLWLGIEHLEAAEEYEVAATVRAIMEGVAEKHGLPVVEADAFANHTGEL